MFGTADSLMLTQYVRYSRVFNIGTICAVQQTVYCSHNMSVTTDSLMLTQYICGIADSLMLTHYVWYSRQFNAHTICVVQQTV